MTAPQMPPPNLTSFQSIEDSAEYQQEQQKNDVPDAVARQESLRKRCETWLRDFGVEDNAYEAAFNLRTGSPSLVAGPNKGRRGERNLSEPISGPGGENAPVYAFVWPPLLTLRAPDQRSSFTPINQESRASNRPHHPTTKLLPKSRDIYSVPPSSSTSPVPSRRQSTARTTGPHGHTVKPAPSTTPRRPIVRPPPPAARSSPPPAYFIPPVPYSSPPLPVARPTAMPPRTRPRPRRPAVSREWITTATRLKHNLHKQAPARPNTVPDVQSAIYDFCRNRNPPCLRKPDVIANDETNWFDCVTHLRDLLHQHQAYYNDPATAGYSGTGLTMPANYPFTDYPASSAPNVPYSMYAGMDKLLQDLIKKEDRKRDVQKQAAIRARIDNARSTAGHQLLGNGDILMPDGSRVHRNGNITRQDGTTDNLATNRTAFTTQWTEENTAAGRAAALNAAETVLVRQRKVWLNTIRPNDRNVMLRVHRFRNDFPHRARVDANGPVAYPYQVHAVNQWWEWTDWQALSNHYDVYEVDLGELNMENLDTTVNSVYSGDFLVRQFIGHTTTNERRADGRLRQEDLVHISDIHALDSWLRLAVKKNDIIELLAKQWDRLEDQTPEPPGRYLRYKPAARRIRRQLLDRNPPPRNPLSWGTARPGLQGARAHPPVPTNTTGSVAGPASADPTDELSDGD